MEARSCNLWVTRKVLFPRLLIPRCIPLFHPELDWNWSPRGACLHIEGWTSLATHLTSLQAHIPVNPKLRVQNGTHYLSSGLPRWRGGKESTCQCRRCRRLGFDPWVGNIPWRRRILAWRSPWMEEPGGLQAPSTKLRRPCSAVCVWSVSLPVLSTRTSSLKTSFSHWSETVPSLPPSPFLTGCSVPTAER